MYDNQKLKCLVKKYIEEPNDVENNWNIALYYDEIGHTASAISFYLRTAERSNDDLLKYECLIRTAMCFEKQGTRKFTVKSIMQHAISLQPHRPEGYYILSLFYELENRNGKWFDAYMAAAIGYSLTDFQNLKPLRTDVKFPGKHALLFQKAHTAWWCGLCDDSRSMFLDLHHNYQLDNMYKKLVLENLIRLNAFSSTSLNLYSSKKYNRLMSKFDGLEKIEKNYSESYQDVFVLMILGGKKNGTYLEIGSGHPTHGNNTYLLEKEFDWRGVSLDTDEEFVKKHGEQRKHTCLLRDATAVNYEKLLSALDFDKNIDYLQIDCDPPSVSYQVLLSIPFETRNFAIITFEHDHYADPSKNYREKARKYLASHGYTLFVSNVSPDKNRPYEDWFVNPDLVNIEELSKFMSIDDETKKAEEYMTGKFMNKKEV